MVFDNSRENDVEPDRMVEYLAFNMELCQRTNQLAGRNADKLLLFMHLTGTKSFIIQANCTLC